MSTRFAVTFSDSGGSNAGVNIFTACSGAALVSQIDVRGARTWADAQVATDLFRQGLWAALANPNGAYPLRDAQAMLLDLDWVDGYSLVHSAVGAPVEFQFTFGDLSCPLLPELVPVAVDGGHVWLDQLGPCSRQLTQVWATPPRVEEPSLAIIYEEGDPLPFGERAEELRQQLKVLSKGQFRVDTFPGGGIASGSDTERLELLNRAFREYRAVMFFGHSQKLGEPAGWMLTPDRPLLLDDVLKRLGSAIGTQAQPAPRRSHPVPEVIFANCCASAGQILTETGEAVVVSPRRFLNAGVRFFVGTSMDVVVDPKLDLVSGLALAFFRRWWADPDGAVRHLYDAKQDHQFHLVTSLYQIYVGQQPRDHVRPVVAAAPPPPQSAGGIVGGIGPGDAVGNYEILRQLWADPHSRTFAARRAGDAQARHLLTVPADQYQDDPGLAERLRAAVDAHRELRTDPALFVPDKYEQVPLSRGKQQLSPIHVLVAERTWVDGCEPLTASMHPGQPAPDFRWVMRLGADVAGGLHALHARDLVHGNLDPGSIVLIGTGAERRAVVKDAWVSPALGGRYTQPRYAPPTVGSDSTDPTDPTRQDSWGLGVILYELASRRSPFDPEHPPEQGPLPLTEALGPAAEYLPPALDGVVRDCLLPAEDLLPSANEIASRLLLGLNDGGADIGDLESALNARVQAGYRLFALYAGDGEEALATLIALTHQRHARSWVMPLPTEHPRPVPRIVYRLYVLAEGVGLIEEPSKRLEAEWFSADDLGLSGVDPAVVATVNAEVILDHIANHIRPEIASGPAGDELQFPVILIRGDAWWGIDVLESRRAGHRVYNQGTLRRLRQFHTDSHHSPAVVLSDNQIFVPNDMLPLFTGMALPPPRPAVLQQTILKYVRAHNRDVRPRAASALAMTLTRHLYPCPRREAEQILRQCVLRDGEVTERAVALRDELREREFRALGTAAYTPPDKLPTLDALGLPDPALGDAHRWVVHLRSGADRSDDRAVPRLVLVTGAEGCGKTCLARALAGSAGRPLVRLDANSWLRGGLGESEATLGRILATVSDLHHAVVLFDELDRFFPPPPGVAPPDYQPTLARMAAILVRWLDHQPEGIVSVLVARSPAGLPPEWQRRVHLRLDLPEPDSVDYRMRVFFAVFGRCGLPALAGDIELIHRLADLTRPGRLSKPLPSPLARCWPELFRGHAVELRTGAQIEAWVQELITLLDAPTSPANTRDFWWNAVP